MRIEFIHLACPIPGCRNLIRVEVAFEPPPGWRMHVAIYSRVPVLRALCPEHASLSFSVAERLITGEGV